MSSERAREIAARKLINIYDHAWGSADHKTIHRTIQDLGEIGTASAARKLINIYDHAWGSADFRIMNEASQALGRIGGGF